jgi:hypothetical protein
MLRSKFVRGAVLHAGLLLASCDGKSAAPVAEEVPDSSTPKPDDRPVLTSSGTGEFAPVAPPPACAPAASGYSDDKVRELVAADYAKLDDAAKTQTLYVSLAHLTADSSECDMRFLRFGIGQLVNMTSWAAKIVAPVFIDEPAQIARVDVRELSWTPEALAYLLTTAPRQDYGVLANTPAQGVVVRADWLAAHLTRPEAYGYMLRIPVTERLMEEQAGVALDAKGIFGGVYHSGVTLHPRMLERRDSKYGACWISHDFYYRTQALLTLESGQLPQADTRFGLQQYIAREYICSLPNGMHYYQLTGFISQRRWDGNTCVAQNRSRKDKLVLNGQCFACHSDGLIPFQDKVRGDNPNPTDYMTANFPIQSELDEIFLKDQQRYDAAISQIPYYDESYSNPLNKMIAIYAQRANDDLVESSGGTFGAVLPNGATGGPIWEDVVNPLASLAVEMGILTPAKVLYQDIPEMLIPAFKEKYKEAGIDEDLSCVNK